MSKNRASRKIKAAPVSTTDPSRQIYLIAVETVENVVFKFVPSACTVAMIATAMPAVMTPYSMAVESDSSRMNSVIDTHGLLRAWRAGLYRSCLRILKGEKPSKLLLQAPVKFEHGRLKEQHHGKIENRSLLTHRVISPLFASAAFTSSAQSRTETMDVHRGY
jgi:hypothetical protein